MSLDLSCEPFAISVEFPIAHTVYPFHRLRGCGKAAGHLSKGPIREDDVWRDALLLCEAFSKGPEPFKEKGVIGSGFRSASEDLLTFFGRLSFFSLDAVYALFSSEYLQSLFGELDYGIPGALLINELLCEKLVHQEVPVSPVFVPACAVGLDSVMSDPAYALCVGAGHDLDFRVLVLLLP